MKKYLPKLHVAVLAFAAWGWPLIIVDLAAGLYDRPERWADAINTVSFLWILSVPAWPITLVLDRARRERMMARLCGLREGDERERTVTGEAARATLLLSLAIQAILLVMCLIRVHLSWDPLAPKGEHHGVLSAGLGFSSDRHLDPFGLPTEGRGGPGMLQLGAPDVSKGNSWEFGGFLISPSAFPILALLILVQLAAFRAYAGRRYEGVDA